MLGGNITDQAEEDYINDTDGREEKSQHMSDASPLLQILQLADTTSYGSRKANLGRCV